MCYILPDTGTEVSILNLEVIGRYVPEFRHMKPECSKRIAATGIAGDVSYVVVVHVAKLNGIDGILGMDFLENTSLNMKDGLLKFNYKLIYLQKKTIGNSRSSHKREGNRSRCEISQTFAHWCAKGVGFY